MTKIKAEKSERLDIFLATHTDISRSKIAKLIDKGKVLVNHEVKPKSYILNDGDIVSYELKKDEVKETNIKIDIVYEDNDIVVVNKDKNVLVHPVDEEVDTLMNALKSRIKVNDKRPGVVHRLDKDTTGLVVFALNDESFIKLKEMFKNREISKKYLALLEGYLEEDEAIIDAPIRRSHSKLKFEVGRGGKSALTKIKVIDRQNNTTLAIIDLITGRTHQIRVHTKYINHPVVGDALYGKDSNMTQALHAYKLSFNHPITTKKISFIAPPKREFIELLEKNGYNIDEVLNNARNN